MNSGLSTFLQLGFVILAALGVYSFVNTAREGEARRLCTPVCSLAPDYAARNRLAPDFELPDLDGRSVKLSDYRGKVVVINFWTKTCAPCLDEMPSLNDFGRALQRHPDIVLLTINTDPTAADARTTLQSILDAPPTFVTLNDPESNVVAGQFGTKLYPETWFVDPNGVIRARVDGPRDWFDLAPLVIDFANTLKLPLACEVEFLGRQPSTSSCDGIPRAG